MRPVRATRTITLSLGLLVIVAHGACNGAPEEPEEEGAWFVDIAAASGIDFLHQDGRSGRTYFIETAAPGGGWIDFDRDGDLDLYLINGAKTPGSELVDSPRNRLYENRDGRFVDVSDRAGVADTEFGMGMCVADFDGDGWQDFLVTNYGQDRLYRNLGDGRFEQVAEAAGVADSRWGTGCAFGDLDGDADLDLYVAHYADFSFDTGPFCEDRRLGKAYCHPTAFKGQADALYINQGNGVFIEQGQARGLVQANTERGLGVVLSDLDNDGDLDIYVANDGAANRLYRNDGSGHFTEDAVIGGAALNWFGQAEAGMGVDIGDLYGDGRFEIYVTNFSLETNTLYRPLGDGLYEDDTREAGLGQPTYRQVGWGVQFIDYDNDADLDVAIANGHVQDRIEQVQTSLRYRQRNQLFENLGEGRFGEATERAGPAWAVREVSRGLAAGDWNNDGRIDVLVTNTNAPPVLLDNRIVTGNHWLGLVLRAPPPNTDAIGTRVELRAESVQVREVRSGGSYLSQPDLRPLFGLGSFSGEVEVEIRWPDGHRQLERSSQLDRYWEIDYRR